MKKVLMVVLSVFMFMSISVGIGFSVGFNFQTQQTDAAKAENEETNEENKQSFKLESVRHYFSDEISTVDKSEISGDKIIVTEDSSEYVGYGIVYYNGIFNENEKKYEIKVTLQPSVKINGYIIHWKDGINEYIYTVQTPIANNGVEASTITITLDKAGWFGLDVFWGEDATVKYGFLENDSKINYDIDNIDGKYGKYNKIESHYNGNTTYSVSISSGQGYMLHSLGWKLKGEETTNEIIFNEKSNEIIGNNYGLEIISGSKYSTINISGFEKFPKELCIVFRKSNEISFALMISTDKDNKHHAVTINNGNQGSTYSVYTSSTGFAVGSTESGTKPLQIGEMLQDNGKTYNHELGLFAIGYKYKIYYLKKENGATKKQYLEIEGNYVESDGITFKACSDLEKYRYVYVSIAMSDINAAEYNHETNIIALYLEESGTPVGLNAHTMSDKLTSLGQYESSNVGGTVIKSETNENIYKVSSNYSKGYDFSAKMVNKLNIGYVTFFPSEILVLNEVGNKDSKSVFAVSMEEVGNSGGVYDLKVHGSGVQIHDDNDEDFVFYDNIFTAYIYYSITAYGEDFIMNLPDNFQIDVYCYFTLQQFEINGINIVDDKPVEDFSVSNTVKVTYELPNDGGEVIMFEKDFSKNLSVYYGASVSLSLMDGNGLRFVGLYYNNGSEDKLISVPSEMEEVSGNAIYKYQFYFNLNTELNLKVKYVSYSTTEKRIYPTNRVYNINSAEDLIWLSNSVQNGNTFEGYLFKQTANIVFKDEESLNPIGTVKVPFKGVYDGNNFNISNLKLFAVNDYAVNLKNVGLFGCTDGATIKNVNIISNNGQVKGLSNVGGVVGYAKNTTFKFVKNFNLDISLKSGDQYISVELFNFKNDVLKYQDDSFKNPEMKNYGGIVGLTENCSFNGVSCSANILTGETESNIKNSGGIVGLANNCQLDKCVYDKNQASSMSGIDMNLINYKGTIVVNNCCVYKEQKETYYYTSVNNNLYSGKIQSIKDVNNVDILSANINGTERELSSDVWFILNDRPELRIFYWGC